jgi:hypothetical protein
MEEKGVLVMLDVNVEELNILLKDIIKITNLKESLELEQRYKQFLFTGKFEPAIHTLPDFKMQYPIFNSLDACLEVIPEGWRRSVDASAPELGIDVKLYFDAEFDEVEVKATHTFETIATCLSIGLAYRWIAQMALAKRLVTAPMGVAFIGIERPTALKNKLKMARY